MADPSPEFAKLITAYNVVRDEYLADPVNKADEDGAEWIAAYYAVIEHPVLSPADAIAKCQFVAQAIDNKEMGWFEEEKVIRSIAKLANTTAHSDTQLIELGRRFDQLAKEYQTGRVATLSKEPGASKRWNEVCYLLIDMHKAIAVIPATTLEGFAVKATAYAFNASPAYGFLDEDQEQETWNFVEELRAAAGMERINSCA